MTNLQHNDEFESFLYKQVKDHRMYPADQIWRNIQKEIHGEGRWPALTYISIFIITALVISTLMVKPEERLHKNTIVYPPQKEEISYQKTKQSIKEAAESTPVQYAYTDKITQRTLQSVSETILARNEEQNYRSQTAIIKTSLLPVEDKLTHDINPAIVLAAVKVSDKSEDLQSHINNRDQKDQSAEPNLQEVNSPYTMIKPASKYFSTLGLLNPADLKKPSDNNSSFYNPDDLWRSYPLLTTTDLIRRKLTKFSFRFYITPSVSYRRLNDANGKKARSYTAIPRSNNYQLDINHVVEHRPAIGAETGFALGYKLTNALTVTGGFQFNMRQYGIKAYTLSIPDPVQEITAGQAISDNLPDQQAVADNSYLTSADHSSFSGQSVVLNNRYYEIAAPIGIDWRMAASSNGRLTINAAASLQPTYTFDKEPFVLTTDYKNYTDGASIMRNWNLNSNVEAYISYKVGPLRWQLGPQFRYQHFSTYSNAYPIREHLLDYGIKLGFTKSLD